MEVFVTQNFKFLAGKIYRPSGWDDRLLLAFEKENVGRKIGLEGAEVLEYFIGKA